MDPENHWLVEENNLPGGPLSGSMLVFGSVSHAGCSFHEIPSTSIRCPLSLGLHSLWLAPKCDRVDLLHEFFSDVHSVHYLREESEMNRRVEDKPLLQPASCKLRPQIETKRMRCPLLVKDGLDASFARHERLLLGVIERKASFPQLSHVQVHMISWYMCMFNCPCPCTRFFISGSCSTVLNCPQLSHVSWFCFPSSFTPGRTIAGLR